MVRAIASLAEGASVSYRQADSPPAHSRERNSRWQQALSFLVGQFAFFWGLPKLFNNSPFRATVGHTPGGCLMITLISSGLELYHQSVRGKGEGRHWDLTYLSDPLKWDPLPMAVFTLQGYSTGIGSNLFNGSKPYERLCRSMRVEPLPIGFGEGTGGLWSYARRTFALNILVSSFWALFFIPYSFSEKKKSDEQLTYIASSVGAQFFLGWIRRAVAWRFTHPNTGPYYTINDGGYILQQGLVAYLFGSH